MGCCALVMQSKTVDGKLMMVCRNCNRVGQVRQVVVRIYPVSGGNSENTEYRCKRCGNRKTRGGRPKDLHLYKVESDWQRKKKK